MCNMIRGGQSQWHWVINKLLDIVDIFPHFESNTWDTELHIGVTYETNCAIQNYQLCLCVFDWTIFVNSEITIIVFTYPQQAMCPRLRTTSVEMKMIHIGVRADDTFPVLFNPTFIKISPLQMFLFVQIS